CLAIYGRLVIIGLMGGAKAELNVGRMMVKRQRIIGSVLRARSIKEKTALTEAFRSEALGLFATGALRPVIHDVLPLDDIVRAHEMMEANANTGKIILTVDPTLSQDQARYYRH
ncbi:MAG: zinc-binding dehydrogenase, partial [Geminicoccaceae bacterium]